MLVGRAARAALAAGATQRAAGLLDHALLHQASAEETARLLWLRGRVQHALGDPDRELDFFLQAVDLSRDPEVRVWAAAEGLLAAMLRRPPSERPSTARLGDGGPDDGAGAIVLGDDGEWRRLDVPDLDPVRNGMPRPIRGAVDSLDETATQLAIRSPTACSSWT